MACTWKVADSIWRSQACKSSRMLMKAHREWEESPAGKRFDSILIESSENNNSQISKVRCIGVSAVNLSTNPHLSQMTPTSRSPSSEQSYMHDEAPSNSLPSLMEAIKAVIPSRVDDNGTQRRWTRSRHPLYWLCSLDSEGSSSDGEHRSAREIHRN